MKTTASGLQYKVITEGTGPKPTASDTVVCNYKGTLIDGKEFDSSYKRGEPATFPVSGVIKGWTEALQLMPVGSKWQLFIPSDLAYGERGAGAEIGPNSTLIFEVELISIKPKEAGSKSDSNTWFCFLFFGCVRIAVATRTSLLRLDRDQFNFKNQS